MANSTIDEFPKSQGLLFSVTILDDRSVKTHWLVGTMKLFPVKSIVGTPGRLTYVLANLVHWALDW